MKKLLLIIGIVPFIVAFGLCFINSTSAIGNGISFLDNLVFYSFLYWPTYIIGVILIISSIIMFKRER